ncbi:MAG: hypothetical protein KDC95_07565 [Planctomycetes bacterium]|nr:hypothetical protein [Planctomycetota bacterium]
MPSIRILSLVAAVLASFHAACLAQDRGSDAPRRTSERDVQGRDAEERDAGRRDSGPRAGESLPKLVVFETGRTPGERDLREEIGKRPALLLFVQVLDRNVAPILRGVDDIDRERALTGFVARSILLYEDRGEGERRIAAVNGSLRMRSPLVLSTDGIEGPGAYALDKDCRATLVFVRGGRVVRSVGLLDPGRQDVAWIRDEVAKIDGALPSTLDEWVERLEPELARDRDALVRELVAARIATRKLEERVRGLEQELRVASRDTMRGRNRGANAQGQNPDARRMRPAQDAREERASTQGRETQRPETQRRGAPPKDPELLATLRAFINKSNDDATCDAAYERIVARAVVSDALLSEANEMFRLVTSLGYGTERAQHLARSFLDRKRPDARKK